MSGMHRFYADEGGIVQGIARLTDEDARHALRVLRLSAGEEIELVFSSSRCLARIETADGDGVSARILSELPSTEAKTRVTLYQGLPKADKMDLIVQKATELGACAVRPVAMERSVVKLDGKDAAKKGERWQKIAREAVKQCARVSAPDVLPCAKLSAIEDELRALDLLIVPWEDARDGSVREALKAVADRPDARIGVLIGPEGGISAKEAGWLREAAGARLVTLGPRILRTETAALCALSTVMALRGELE